MKFCTHCGAELNENAAFCSQCGCTVESVASGDATSVLKDTTQATALSEQAEAIAPAAEEINEETSVLDMEATDLLSEAAPTQAEAIAPAAEEINEETSVLDTESTDLLLEAAPTQAEAIAPAAEEINEETSVLDTEATDLLLEQAPVISAQQVAPVQQRTVHVQQVAPTQQRTAPAQQYAPVANQPIQSEQNTVDLQNGMLYQAGRRQQQTPAENAVTDDINPFQRAGVTNAPTAPVTQNVAKPASKKKTTIILCIVIPVVLIAIVAGLFIGGVFDSDDTDDIVIENEVTQDYTQESASSAALPVFDGNVTLKTVDQYLEISLPMSVADIQELTQSLISEEQLQMDVEADTVFGGINLPWGEYTISLWCKNEDVTQTAKVKDCTVTGISVSLLDNEANTDLSVCGFTFDMGLEDIEAKCGKPQETENYDEGTVYSYYIEGENSTATEFTFDNSGKLASMDFYL